MVYLGNGYSIHPLLSPHNWAIKSYDFSREFHSMQFYAQNYNCHRNDNNSIYILIVTNFYVKKEKKMLQKY